MVKLLPVHSCIPSPNRPQGGNYSKKKIDIILHAVYYYQTTNSPRVQLTNQSTLREALGNNKKEKRKKSKRGIALYSNDNMCKKAFM